MNKAFLREPDQVDSRCPRCDAAGHPVGPQTLAAQVTPELLQTLAESGYFCPTPSCDVLYYDDFGGIIRRDPQGPPVPGKDVDAPLCACFGFGREDVEEDVHEGTVTRTRAAVQRAQSSEARCVTQAPNGRSCVAEIQKYYFRCKQQEES